jgi:hypothetical protein
MYNAERMPLSIEFLMSVKKTGPRLVLINIPAKIPFIKAWIEMLIVACFG